MLVSDHVVFTEDSSPSSWRGPPAARRDSSEPDPNPRTSCHPVVSEKSYRLAKQQEIHPIVAPGANKTQIRQAVQVVFGVR